MKTWSVTQDNNLKQIFHVSSHILVSCNGLMAVEMDLLATLLGPKGLQPQHWDVRLLCICRKLTILAPERPF